MSIRFFKKKPKATTDFNSPSGSLSPRGTSELMGSSPPNSPPNTATLSQHTNLPFVQQPSSWMTGGIGSGYKKPETKPDTEPKTSVELGTSPPQSTTNTDESSEPSSENNNTPVATAPIATNEAPFRKSPSPWMTQGIGKYGSSGQNNSPRKEEDLSSQNSTTSQTSDFSSPKSTPAPQPKTSVTDTRTSKSVPQKPRTTGLAPMKKPTNPKNQKVDKTKRIVILGCRNVGEYYYN